MGDKKKAFVVISFSKEFKNVYDSAIEPAIEANELTPLRADGEDTVLRKIDDDIVKKIEEAEIIIIDVSIVKDDKNKIIDLSNIYFELGLAMARAKRCIILTQDPKKIVFDISGYGVVEYNKDNHKELKEKLTNKIKKALEEEPIDIFKNIDNVNQNRDKSIRKSLKSELLNDLFKIIGESNVPFNISEISDIMRMKLRKLFTSQEDLIEIKFHTLGNESVRHIRITEKGLNYLAENL